VPGQWLRETDRDPRDGVGHRDSLFLDEIIKEEADRLQMAGDCFRSSSFLEQMIYIQTDLLAGDLAKRHGSPSQEMIDDIHIALEGVSRVVFPLQSSPISGQLSIVH
jgi:hypothetical protein